MTEEEVDFIRHFATDHCVCSRSNCFCKIKFVVYFYSNNKDEDYKKRFIFQSVFLHFAAVFN